VSGELIPDGTVCGVPACSISGADGLLISVGISTALFCLLGVGHNAGRRSPGLPLDQMVVAAKHTPDFAASRGVKRREDKDENILALYPLVRCSFNTAHRDAPRIGGLWFREGNMSAIARDACDFFHRPRATLTQIDVSDLDGLLISP
jgi:hypothetical protein